MKELKSGPLISGIALAVILIATIYSYTAKHASRAPGNSSDAPNKGPERIDMKDSRIRERLTGILAELSSKSVGKSATRDAMANLDALMGVEALRCSPQQCGLLRQAKEHLEVVAERWESYKIHAGQDSDPAEDKKAKEAIAEMYAALDRAKREISEAAATF